MNLYLPVKLILISAYFATSVEFAYSLDRNQKDTATQVLSDPIGVSNFFQMFLGLLFIIILIIGLAWFVKRVNGLQGNMVGVLKVISMISVGQREKLVLVQVGEQQLLIGVASGNVSTLLVLDENITNENANKLQTSFAERLATVLKGKSVKI